MNQPFDHRRGRTAPTAIESIISINLARDVSAAVMAAIICFDVLELEQKKHDLMTAIALIIVTNISSASEKTNNPMNQRIKGEHG